MNLSVKAEVPISGAALDLVRAELEKRGCVDHGHLYAVRLCRLCGSVIGMQDTEVPDVETIVVIKPWAPATDCGRCVAVFNPDQLKSISRMIAWHQLIGHAGQVF